MTKRSEQRVCIKFWQELGHSCLETISKIRQVYGNESMSDTQITHWFRRFKSGCTLVESDSRFGRPATARNLENVQRVRVLINQNRRLNVREIEEELEIPRTLVWEILRQDLGMSRVAAKFVPRLLTEQKNYRVKVAQENLEAIGNNPVMFEKVITGDESWVYGYDPEKKAETSQWKTPEGQRPKRACQSQSNIKAMLTVFFDQKGVVHHEYAPEGQEVNKEYHQEVLRRLSDAVRKKRPVLW